VADLNGGRYLALLGALGLQRLLELGWSARNLRRRPSGPAASPRTFPLMVLANVALFTVPALTRWGRPRPPRPVRLLAGAGLVAATGLRLWSIASLGSSWNVRGQVPPDLRPVRRGPYRWIRHPNYLAVALEFAAVPLLAGGYLEAVALSAANAAVLWPRIRAEEELLESNPAYREAFAGVPRFMPRRPGRASPGPRGARSPSTRS